LFCAAQGVKAGTTTVAFTVSVFMTVGAIYNIAAAKKQANTIYIYLPWFFGLCSNKQN
jgi:hypothetical protein